MQLSGSYLRLSGFVIENSLGISSANVYLANSASYVELSGNEIRQGQDQGVFSERTTSHLSPIANFIHDNGWNHQPGQHSRTAATSKARTI